MAALSLTRKEVIHVAFVALGDGFRRRLDAVANHIRASTSHAVQFHAIVSAEPPPPPSSVPSCCRLHMVGDAPPLVHAQHRNLTNRRAVKTAAFLWKPFLFRVLTDIDRVIVLDFGACTLRYHLWRLTALRLRCSRSHTTMARRTEAGARPGSMAACSSTTWRGCEATSTP